jgi:hypothetical protein
MSSLNIYYLFCLLFLKGRDKALVRYFSLYNYKLQCELHLYVTFKSLRTLGNTHYKNFKNHLNFFLSSSFLPPPFFYSLPPFLPFSCFLSFFRRRCLESEPVWVCTHYWARHSNPSSSHICHKENSA